jgi:hypothetical protein
MRIMSVFLQFFTRQLSACKITHYSLNLQLVDIKYNWGMFMEIKTTFVLCTVLLCCVF